MPPVVRRKRRRSTRRRREVASASAPMWCSTRAWAGVCGSGSYSSFETRRVGRGAGEVKPWRIPADRENP